MFIRFLRNTYLNASKMFNQGEVVDVDQQYGARLIADGVAVNVVDDLSAIGRAPIVLMQTAIPMVLQSSGSVAANGALSGLTALPFASFPHPAFMYFPAGAVFAASPAGMYFVILSSTTAGTIFNNVYTSGAPRIPTFLIPIVAAGPGAYTQTTAAAITLLSFDVPGGLLGPNGLLRSQHVWSALNNANSKNVTHLYANLSSGTTGNVTGQPGARGITEWRNRGDSSRQMYTQSAGVLFQANIPAYGASDSTIVQPYQVQANLIGAATDYLILEAVDLTVQPGA